MEVRQSILQARYSFSHNLWKEVSEAARDLIMRLLVRDPVLRLDATAALRHPWLQVGVWRVSWVVERVSK